MKINPKNVNIQTRLIILFIFLCITFGISIIFTGKFIPEEPMEITIFIESLILIFIGSTVQEFYYSTPIEGLVNSFASLITLFQIYNFYPINWWVFLFLLSLIIFVLSIFVVVKDKTKASVENNNLYDFSYKIVTILGKSKVLYTILFLISLLNYYSFQSKEAITLVIFWGIYMILWPSNLPAIITDILTKKSNKVNIGTIIQTNWPNLIHIDLKEGINWSFNSPKLFKEASGEKFLTLPLYKQYKKEKTIGTGIYLNILNNEEKEKITGFKNGNVYNYKFDLNYKEIIKRLDGGEKSEILGFVGENSNIIEIFIELSNPHLCKQGSIIWCKPNNLEKVYYQIIDGNNNEENFHQDKYGFQVAKAIQLGKIKSVNNENSSDESEFTSYDWIPQVNTPIFIENDEFGDDICMLESTDFCFGNIPNSKIKVGGNFIKNMSKHTAILGITGSGKTELALDIINHVTENNHKVICIDITNKYIKAFENTSFEQLMFEKDENNNIIQIETLEEHLNNIMNATNYNESTRLKLVLNTYKDELMNEFTTRLSSFFSNDKMLGILSIDELGNSLSILHLTELFMTSLLNYAKAQGDNMQDILLVVEESHTVMPEQSTMGLPGKEAQSLVARTSQLALQGRKYGVGLLVIAQRTATVSKSILTQCNTIISFNCFDNTSLEFLRNFYGDKYTNSIPSLPKLSAMIYGKSFKSRFPMIVEIPYDENKVNNNY